MLVALVQKPSTATSFYKDGQLNGAKFSGDAEINPSGESQVTGRYEGALMGDAAKELAGKATFAGRLDLDTAFGGNK